MARPPSPDLAACEAVQLFVDRATRMRPGFALTEANSAAVADICRRLDGIPLAIELAAARVRVFTPAQIAAGLDQRFALLTGSPRTALPRQQTLEASVDWSHDLLTEEEQAVFRRLSVFAGDFDYDAAVAVCAAPPIAAHQVLDQLSLLVDKSLVLVDDSGEQARYRLLETVREYAAGRLARTDEETTTRTAHRDHYLAFAEAAEPHLEGPGQTEWMAMVAADYPNLGAALSWSRAHGDNEQLARIAAAIHLYWGIHGPNSDGAAWLEDALEADGGLPPWLRAKTLLARAQLAGFNFDVVNISLRAQEGVGTARELGDDRLTARFLALLAQVSMLMGQPDGTADEAEELAREVGDPWALAWSLTLQGAARYFIDPAAARRYYEEARLVADTAGNMATAHLSAGFVCGTLCLAGQPIQARVLCDQVAAEADADGDRMTVAMTMMYSATALADADERVAALGYADRLELAAAELDMHLWKTYVPHIRSRIALADGDDQACPPPGRRGGWPRQQPAHQGRDAARPGGSRTCPRPAPRCRLAPRRDGGNRPVRVAVLPGLRARPSGPTSAHGRRIDRRRVDRARRSAPGGGHGGQHQDRRRARGPGRCGRRRGRPPGSGPIAWNRPTIARRHRLSPLRLQSQCRHRGSASRTR